MKNSGQTVRLVAAAPDVEDPNFKKSVVVVIENDHEGSFGFVVNKLSSRTDSELFESEVLKEVSAYVGGPVDQNRLFLMVPSELLKMFGVDELLYKDDILNFNSDIRVVSDEMLIEEMMKKYRKASPFERLSIGDKLIPPDQFFAGQQRQIEGASHIQGPGQNPFKLLNGYSGWDLGQLEEEIHDGMWLEVPMDAGLVFSPAAHVMWKEALARIGLKNIEAYQVPATEWLN